MKQERGASRNTCKLAESKQVDSKQMDNDCKIDGNFVNNFGLHWLAISFYCVSNLNDGNCLSGNLWQHGNGCQHVDARQHGTTHDDTRTTMTSAKSPRAGCRQSMGRQEIVQAWRLERKCRSLVVNVGHNAGLCHQIWAHFNMSRLSSAHLQT